MQNWSVPLIVSTLSKLCKLYEQGQCLSRVRSGRQQREVNQRAQREVFLDEGKLPVQHFGVEEVDEQTSA